MEHPRSMTWLLPMLSVLFSRNPEDMRYQHRWDPHSALETWKVCLAHLANQSSRAAGNYQVFTPAFKAAVAVAWERCPSIRQGCWDNLDPLGAGRVPLPVLFNLYRDELT